MSIVIAVSFGGHRGSVCEAAAQASDWSADIWMENRNGPQIVIVHRPIHMFRKACHIQYLHAIPHAISDCHSTADSSS